MGTTLSKKRLVECASLGATTEKTGFGCFSRGPQYHYQLPVGPTRYVYVALQLLESAAQVCTMSCACNRGCHCVGPYDKINRAA